MKKTLVAIVLAISCLLLASGCRRAVPLYQPSIKVQAKSTAQVRKIVKSALKRRNWIIKSSGSNHFTARYGRGARYSALIRVDFSSSKVSIKRLKSTGLHYESSSEDGELIHKRFNGWMRFLERDIELELSHQ